MRLVSPLETVLMDLNQLASDAGKTIQEILGYLNFSAGNPDPRFLQGINSLFGQIEGQRPQAADPRACRRMPSRLGGPWRG